MSDLPDVIYAGEKIYPNDYGAEWMEKDGLGREKYYHSRIVEALKAENEELKAKLPECKCTFAQKTVGDGCQSCNPQMAIDLLSEQVAELKAKLDNAKWQPIDVEKLKREVTDKYIEHSNGNCDQCSYEAVSWAIDRLAAHYNITKKGE